jgi:uridine nucleosidase
LSILEAIGRPEINVFPGAAKPFCRESHTAPNIHGASGLAGTDLLPQPSRTALTHCNAILEMKEALFAQPKGTAWLVATGPLTNVALLLSVFPSLAEHIAGFSMMGGAIGGDFTHVSVSSSTPLSRLTLRSSYILHRLELVKPALFESMLTSRPATKMGGQPYTDSSGVTHKRFGNSTPFAEFNIWADPEASRAVLQNPVLRSKTTVIPLDVTHQAYATPKIQKMLLNGCRGPTRLRIMYNELLMFFAHTYDTVFGLKDGPPLHDPLAVAAILSHESSADSRITFNDNDGERWDVDVILEGEQFGRTVAEKSPDGQGIIIPRTLDLDKFWQTLDACMGRADEATGYQQ